LHDLFDGISAGDTQGSKCSNLIKVLVREVGARVTALDARAVDEDADLMALGDDVLDDVSQVVGAAVAEVRFKDGGFAAEFLYGFLGS